MSSSIWRIIGSGTLALAGLTALYLGVVSVLNSGSPPLEVRFYQVAAIAGGFLYLATAAGLAAGRPRVRGLAIVLLALAIVLGAFLALLVMNLN